MMNHATTTTKSKDPHLARFKRRWGDGVLYASPKPKNNVAEPRAVVARVAVHATKWIGGQNIA